MVWATVTPLVLVSGKGRIEPEDDRAKPDALHGAVEFNAIACCFHLKSQAGGSIGTTRAASYAISAARESRRIDVAVGADLPPPLKLRRTSQVGPRVEYA